MAGSYVSFILKCWQVSQLSIIIVISAFILVYYFYLTLKHFLFFFSLQLVRSSHSLVLHKIGVLITLYKIHRRSSCPEVFCKETFLTKINSQKNTCTRISFLIKLQTERSQFIKKDTNTTFSL